MNRVTNKEPRHDRTDFLETMKKAGIFFTIYLEGGYCDLEIEDIFEYLNDPISVEAKYKNVSVEHLKAWRKWKDSGFICYGTTRKGKPCKLYPDRLPFRVVQVGVVNYIPGESEYCKWHIGQSAIHNSRKNNE